MDENNIYVNKENIEGQIEKLDLLISEHLVSDKLSEISSLIANNMGETATTLQNICSTMLTIEETMTDLISSTSTVLTYVDSAYESADTVEAK